MYNQLDFLQINVDQYKKKALNFFLFKRILLTQNFNIMFNYGTFIVKN